MKLLLIFSAFILLYEIKSLHLKTFESAVEPRSIADTDGIDIIKILNLDTIKSSQDQIETSESEVLRHKSINKL